MLEGNHSQRVNLFSRNHQLSVVSEVDGRLTADKWEFDRLVGQPLIPGTGQQITAPIHGVSVDYGFTVPSSATLFPLLRSLANRLALSLQFILLGNANQANISVYPRSRSGNIGNR